MNKPPDCFPHTPRRSYVIETDSGRIFASRLTSESVCLEMHRGGKVDGTYEVRFMEINLKDAQALAIALEELSK